ncbi:MAG: hypothetical protein E7116_00220 [Bacteroidales bacterium]|nr:hypothetical protein [Bacteroidales bacterium]
MMSRRQIFFLNIIFLLSFGALQMHAQVSPVDSLVSRGDSLRRVYRFDQSLEAYNKALDMVSDTSSVWNDSTAMAAISDLILLSENGKSMTGFVYKPNVVARHMFSKDDFFLYYPLKDRSWRPTPNQLDSVPGLYSKAIYVPAEAESIYFSAADKDGIRNIYMTELGDSLWTVPELINEHLTSASDEIYPMLSSDGKSMYFASKGLYGVGGYDLYVSQWDEDTGDWSVPVNMGFPYSSPANDFLLAGSEDGGYTLFASDRDCPKDSVWIYVLEADNMPVRSEMSDPDELSDLARLELSVSMDVAEEVKSDIPENADTRRYMDKMAQVRSLRDSISAYEDKMQEYRDRYAVVESEVEKNRLAELILKNESYIPEIQASLEEAMKELQEIEMDFLFSGVVIDADKLLVEAEREVVSEDAGYVFAKMTLGEPLHLDIERPEPEFDYSFRILDTAQFVTDTTIPEGIAYQIQVFSTTIKASEKALKGLCPVFETRSASGRYIYRVGLFNEYKDVLANLNTVKRAGFRNAYIVGYVDGKEMSVNKVRTEEKARKETAVELYRVSIIPTGGVVDSAMIEGIRQQSAGKDVARHDGGLVVGPFNNKSQAVALVEFIEVMRYGDATIEVIENN